MALGNVPAHITLAGAAFDAASLEYEPDTDSARMRLALLSVYTNDFSVNFGELTEVDSGANVAVAGGLLTIKGSGVWDVNGVYLTALKAIATPGKIQIEVTPRTSAQTLALGFATAAALNRTDTSLKAYSTAGLRPYVAGDALHLDGPLVVGTTYLMEFEWTADKHFTCWITGGVYAARTRFYEVFHDLFAGPNIGFQINACVAWATPWEFDNYERFSGFDATSPVITLAHIDSGLADSEWFMNTVDFAGSSAGLKYQYAHGNAANPVNWNGVWLTLAQLLLEPNPTGQYFRLRIQVASDGATQREITEGSIDCALECSAPVGNPPYCCGAIDAAPAAQGCILVRFCEMDCAAGTVPYRYDFHVKHLSLGPLTCAEINAGTWYARSCYNDEVNFAAGSPGLGSPGPNPAILQALIAFEAWNQHGDNIHLFTNREYQVAVRAIAIDASDTIYEDDNCEVVVSYSSGYQGIQWEHILSWPCTYFCDGAEIGIKGPVSATIGALPPVAVSGVENVSVKEMPNLDVGLRSGAGFGAQLARLGEQMDKFVEALVTAQRGRR